MRLITARYVLRDLVEGDRAAFAAYQMDPRYRSLYDYAQDDVKRAHDLFDLFLSWQRADPRENFQLGIFERAGGRLCGSAGLRTSHRHDGTAVFGIELTPDHWGRYRLAIEVAEALCDHGFGALGLAAIVGETSSGNRRIARLARWFGAQTVPPRQGPAWMAAPGSTKVGWCLTREAWLARRGLT